MHYPSALRRFLLYLFSLSLLSACCASQQPVMNFTPDDIGPGSTKINAELKSVSVNIASGSKTPCQVHLSHRCDNYEQLFTLAVKDALEKSAENSKIFDDFSRNKLALVATIMKYETVNLGTTDLIIHYQLFNRATHELMYAKAIESIGAVAGSNDVFKADKRFNEARNMAVQANIQQFIVSLKEFKGFTAKPEKPKHHKRKVHKDKAEAKQKAD